MEINLFDFELPEKRIAQRPLEPRDSSKLLLCRSQGRLGQWSAPFEFSHLVFRDIAEHLSENDFLVMNNAKVLPVRLLGRRAEGTGAVEALLLKKLAENEWSAIMHLSARVRPGLQVIFEPGVVAEILSTHEERIANEGEVRLRFSGIALTRIPLESWLERHGHVPLPPYIDRSDTSEDKKTYQTIYASKSGSAAAPTAGFHFTDELFGKLKVKSVQFGQITLHVGIGTFRPMKGQSLDEHVMHEEIFEISEEFATQYEAARAQGKRIVAVGTTVVRALESWDAAGRPGVYSTRAFIKPGYEFKRVDDLITNFHLPRSTLLVLVGAAMGVEAMQEAYRQALAHDYRFFSYGDAMLIRGR